MATRSQRAKAEWARRDPVIKADQQRRGRNSYYAAHPGRRPPDWTPDPGPEVESAAAADHFAPKPGDLVFEAGGLWWIIRR